MTNATRANLGNMAFWVMLAWLIVYAVAYLWPVSYWYEVRSVRVFDTPMGMVPRMAVDREIKRPFVGQWGVNVRVVSTGGYTQTCAAGAVSTYQPGSELPKDLDLAWWTNGRCTALPPGEYVVYTTWDIRGNWLMPDKNLTVVSNIFKVTPT